MHWTVPVSAKTLFGSVKHANLEPRDRLTFAHEIVQPPPGWFQSPKCGSIHHRRELCRQPLGEGGKVNRFPIFDGDRLPPDDPLHRVVWLKLLQLA
jgi:hypothetical protein